MFAISQIRSNRSVNRIIISLLFRNLHKLQVSETKGRLEKRCLPHKPLHRNLPDPHYITFLYLFVLKV